MKTDKTVSACIIYSFKFPWIWAIFSCVRRKSSFNLLWNNRLTFRVSHNLWPPQIKTASSTDSLSLARCTGSGSCCPDMAWCTMVLVLPCFIYVMPSICIARNCMITPKLLHPCACIVKATIYKCTVAADLGPELLADLFIAICFSLASVLLCFASF